jgi:hypothetical protein
VAMSDEQRARLLRAQLGALVRDLTGSSVEAATVGANAAVVDGGAAYVQSQVADAATLAGAIAWSLRQDASSLVLFTDDLAGDVARMAGHFDMPIEVRAVRGAGSVPVEPAPLPEPAAPAQRDPELEQQLVDAGLEVVVEDGVVRGEVEGLEVARIVLWPEELGGDGRLHLEAGVGRFDRDAVAAMHQGEPPTTSLARSVSMVRAERVPGRDVHPLSRLARERWLRRSIVLDPSLVGAAELDPIETTVRRDSVRDVTPAAAAGTSVDGSPLVVVCSTGADLSFVPVAADTRERRDPSAGLVLAVPARDRLPTLDRLAGLLRTPATVVSVPAPWVADGAEGGS